jgi:hypothetical protein
MHRATARCLAPVCILALCLLSGLTPALASDARSPKSGPAANLSRHAEERSCRRFVQEFYKWYVPACDKMTSQQRNSMLKQRYLSPELFRDLMIDEDAQAKNPHVEVGLDFDPFEDTNCGWDHFAVGKITRKKDSYWVTVHGSFPFNSTDKLYVVPELVLKNGTWRFVNFHYLQRLPHDDLKNVLKTLREHRKADSNK